MKDDQRATVVWLVVVFGMILAMVIVGGVTRLTGSGLSMVDWHPLMGALPPLSEDVWLQTFARYQESPQYQQVNHWMTLGDFQRIFFWEYLHRLLGRLIGVVFFVPWVVLLIKGRLRGKLAVKTAIAFVLGGAQGLLGWFMVMSGLVDVPAVSHLRLAAHLSLAFFVAMWVLWIILDLTSSKPERASFPGWAAWTAVCAVSLQVVYGAFMAGKKAGLLYNTFPDMNGSLWPPGAFAMEPALANLVNNPVFIHAFHRGFAWLVALGLLAFSARYLAAGGRRARLLLGGIAAVVLLQMTLGALVVVYSVPTLFAALHQVGGFALLSLCVACAHMTCRARR